MKYKVLLKAEVEAENEDEAIEMALDQINHANDEGSLDDVVDEISEIP